MPRRAKATESEVIDAIITLIKKGLQPTENLIAEHFGGGNHARYKDFLHKFLLSERGQKIVDTYSASQKIPEHILPLVDSYVKSCREEAQALVKAVLRSCEADSNAIRRDLEKDFEKKILDVETARDQAALINDEQTEEVCLLTEQLKAAAMKIQDLEQDKFDLKRDKEDYRSTLQEMKRKVLISSDNEIIDIPELPASDASANLPV
jgi:hypothetical protein